MAHCKPTREEVQQILTCLVVAIKDSTTCGVPIPVLEREYKDQEGTRIPFRELGHSCLMDLFRSMSSSLMVRQRNGVNVVYPIIKDKWAHVSSLVAGQKDPHRRPRGGKRPIMRSTPWYPQVTYPPRRLDSRILGDIASMARNRRDGMPISEVLRYIQDRSNTNFELADLKLQLREINHEVVIERDVIYSLSNYYEPTNNTQNNGYVQNYHATNNNVAETTDNHGTIRAVGSSKNSNEDIKDCSEQLDYQSNTHATLDKEAPNICNGNDDNNNDNDRTESEAQEPCEIKNMDEGDEVHGVEDNQEVSEDYENGDKDNIGMLISERTRFRLEKLIQNHPEGIWCADLPDLYQKEYKLPLNYEELGFGSVSDFAAYLPDVFHALQLQDKGDFKLFDAKAERPNLKPRERPNRQSLAALHKIYETYNEPEEPPVPALLPKETCERLIPDGVMTLGETVPQISVTELQDGTTGYIDVIVVELFTPSFFWIQLLNRTVKFDKFMNDLHAFYTIHAKKYVMPLIVMEKGLNCACQYDNIWHRGIIKTVKHDNTVTVLFYDYGTVQTCPPEEIHFLHRSFSALPAQAIPCGHYNLKPVDGDKWSKSAALQFSLQVMAKPLVATIAVTDVDNNSMLIGLTNTEETEDFHIGDWMVQNGFAAYGRMVCIRPRNYPFRRFLECEYNDVNRSGTKSSRKLSKIVELNESNDAVKSLSASMNTKVNLEWYKVFLELRRSAKSDKKQSQICDVAVSEARREDPKILNKIESQTGKNLMPLRDITTNENNRALIDVHTSPNFGTGLLAKMCKDRANRDASMYIGTAHKTSSSNCKSVASSSSESFIVSDKVMKDQRIANAGLTTGNNSHCVHHKSSIVSSSKSYLSSCTELPRGLVNEVAGSIPLHLRDPPMKEKTTECSEFGNFRSIHGGHGRMQSIDWSQIRGVEPSENINEALKKQKAKKLLPNRLHYNELRKQRDATRSFAEESTTSSSTSTFLPAKKTPRSKIDKAIKNSIENYDIHGQNATRHGKSLTIKCSNNYTTVDETAQEVNRISTTALNSKLPASKIKLWNIVEKSKDKSLATPRNTMDKGKKNSIDNEKIRDQSHGKSSTIKHSNNYSAIDETAGKVDQISMTTLNPKLPASKLKLWNIVEKSKKKSLATATNNKVSTPEVLQSVTKLGNIVEKIEEKSVVAREADEPTTLPNGKLAAAESTLWKELERNKENNLVLGDFHSPLGGRGRMDPCKWSDVLSPEKNVIQSSQIEMEDNENSSKLETELWTNLPKANKDFLNIVNSVSPNEYPRDAAFERHGIIRMTNDVSVTVRRALKRLDEDRSEKRVQLAISEDFLQLLRNNENETNSISSSNTSKPQNATVGSNGTAQSFFDAIVQDSESSKSPKDSSKLDNLLTSLSIESSVSADQNILVLQTMSNNSLNTTPDILQLRVKNVDESENNCESSLSMKIEDSNFCIDSTVAKPSARLLNKLSELIAAPQDTINDSALDSDDLSSDDDESETPIKSTVSLEKEDVKDAKNGRDDTVSKGRTSDSLTNQPISQPASQPPVTKSSSPTAIFEFARSEDKNNEPTKSINETEKLIIKAKLTETPSTFADASSLQLSKKTQPMIPVFNDIDIEEKENDDWDFVPHRGIPASFHESSTKGENFEDIDDDEFFKEDNPRLELDNISKKEVSNCDESSGGISEEDRPLLESLENSSAAEITNCYEISVEQPEEERLLLENERLKNDSLTDCTSLGESSLEISHAELETDEGESSRQETSASETRSLETNNFSIDKKYREKNDKIDDNHKYVLMKI